MASKQSMVQERRDTAAIPVVDARLDAALADTFPASDPVAITVCKPSLQPRAAGRSPVASKRVPVMERPHLAVSMARSETPGEEDHRRASDHMHADGGPTACQMRLLIVGLMLLAGLVAHALRRWWPLLAGHTG